MSELTAAINAIDLVSSHLIGQGYAEESSAMHNLSIARSLLAAHEANGVRLDAQDRFCDSHCTWRDHHPDCARSDSVPGTPAPDLRSAAQAVLDRWNSPKWEWAKQGPTADLMADLRRALDGVPPAYAMNDETTGHASARSFPGADDFGVPGTSKD